MRGYNPKVTELFDSLSPSERHDLRWMLDCGVTQEDAFQLLKEGLIEEAQLGAKSLDGIAVRFTRSALQDLECFGSGDMRKQLDIVLRGLGSPNCPGRSLQLNGGSLRREDPFRIVLANRSQASGTIVVAVASAGISPTTPVWRYFDRGKAEDLMATGSLYFCRLDKLTGDSREGRLPHISSVIRKTAFKPTFGTEASTIVEESTEILRATSYVCCWTRRRHESYLAWKHYCPSGGGFAIRTTWRHIAHLHTALRKANDQVFCRTVGYLDPFRDNLPDHAEGEQVFWKANWFSDETEIRLAVFRHKSGAHPDLLAQRDAWPSGEKIPINLEALAQEIVINPFATDLQKSALTACIKERQPSLIDRVKESAIARGDFVS